MKTTSPTLVGTARKGFTLIELLVVILILGILAALIVPRLLGHSGEAKAAAAKTDISSIESMMSQFRLDCDRYPTSDEGLAALSSTSAPSGLEGKWKGPYSQKPIGLDPWGHPYVYKCPGSNGDDSFIVESYGSDGAEGGTGEAADIIGGSQ